MLSCCFRELGGLIRTAGDIATQEGAPLIEAQHVQQALRWSLPVEQQIACSMKNASIKEDGK
jgi:Lon-like ATP-dependent protease